MVRGCGVIKGRKYEFVRGGGSPVGVSEIIASTTVAPTNEDHLVIKVNISGPFDNPPVILFIHLFIYLTAPFQSSNKNRRSRT